MLNYVQQRLCDRGDLLQGGGDQVGHDGDDDIHGRLRSCLVLRATQKRQEVSSDKHVDLFYTGLLPVEQL